MINTTNLIKLNNFKPNYKPQINYNQNPFKVNGDNLKPLAKDTVNFTGLIETRSAIQNQDICEKTHNDAQPVKKYLENALKEHFSPLIYNKDYNPQGIIEPIKARVKSADSIEEKVADKVDRALRTPDIKNLIFSPYDENDIKNNLRDIVGTRIIIKNEYDDTMKKVADSMCAAIKDKGLIIEEMENHTLKNQGVKPYFSQEVIQQIEQTVNEVRIQNGLNPIKAYDTESKSGYTALHLDIDLSKIEPDEIKHLSEEEKAQFKGFYGEIQILGQDVELLKDIEDFCYKLKADKGIKAHHTAYSPFENFFLEAWQNTKEFPNVKEKFEDYTIAAFKKQRERKPSEQVMDDTTNWAYRYPTIEECGLSGEIPKILDFNILARIKRDCDDLYKVYENTDKILAEILAPKQ